MEYSRTLRLLDRYAGSVLCFVFSVLYTLRRTPREKAIRKVLVIELFEMGASIMAHSSLRYIKKTVPDAEVFCLCLASTKESWLLLPDISKENVHAIDNGSLVSFAFSIWRTARILSSKDIDLIIDLELFTRISGVLAFLIRARYRAGFFRYTMEGLYRGTFYDIKCAFNQNMHIARNFLALTKSALSLSKKYYNYDGPIPLSDVETPSYTSDVAVRETVRGKIRDVYKSFAGQPIILVNPTVGHLLRGRDYPKEQYVDVVKRLLKQYPKHLVMLTGTEMHGPVTEYIDKEVNDSRCVNFRGQTASVAEFLELCLMSDLLITNDSGPAHFASMTPLKVLVLFGPETPFMYGPLGNAVCLYEFFHSSPSISAYNHKNPPSDVTDSLKVIEPRRVVNMAGVLLDGKAVYRTINNEIPYLV